MPLEKPLCDCVCISYYVITHRILILVDTFNAVEVIGLVFFTFFQIAHGHAVLKSQPRAAMRGKTGFCKKEREWSFLPKIYAGVLASCMVAMLGVPMHSVKMDISYVKTG